MVALRLVRQPDASHRITWMTRTQYKNEEKVMIKKALLLAFAAFALITSVTGCRTAHGAGEDMERAGEKIQDKTDR